MYDGLFDLITMPAGDWSDRLRPKYRITSLLLQAPTTPFRQIELTHVYAVELKSLVRLGVILYNLSIHVGICQFADKLTSSEPGIQIQNI